MRAFVALKIPAEIKKEAAKIQKELTEAGIQANWVKPKNTHLTLAFLGSVAEAKTEAIKEILEKTSRQVKPIKLHFLKIDGFPNLAKARVVFVDLGGEKGKLHALALKIRKGLQKEKIFTQDSG